MVEASKLVPTTAAGQRAAYDAADPVRWRRAVADARALEVAEAVMHRGRETVRDELGLAHVSGVDRLLPVARECRADPARLALALAVKPALMRAALIDAASGWRIEPARGIVSRHYGAGGQDVTDTGDEGVYVRAVRVDLGAYCYGLSTPELREQHPRAFVMDGETDDPAEAVRLVLDRPLPLDA